MKHNLVEMFLILCSFILILPANVTAQDAGMENSMMKEGNELIYKALVNNDKNTLLSSREKFEGILKIDSSNAVAQYNLTFSEYKLLEMSLQKGNEELFDRFYQTAINDAEKLISQKEYSSGGKSLLAAVYMMKIASSPMSAVTLSSKINGLLDDAEELNPKNSEAYLIRGMMKYNTPGMFGGSYEDAVKNFNKAAALFEQSTDSLYANTTWGKLEALAWLGRSFEKLKNPDAAKFTYQKALSFEPNYRWIKYVLLPALEKNSNEK